MSEFGATDYQDLLDAMRHALAGNNEHDLKAIMSNHVNVLLAALEMAADQSPF